MKPNNHQITTPQPSTTRNFRNLTKQEKELKKIYQKYHPMETNKAFKVDDEYKKKLNFIFGIEVK